MDKNTEQKDKTKKKNNAAINAFKHERPKGFIRNRFLAALIDFIIVGFLCQLSVIAFGMPNWGAYMESQDAIRDLPREDQRVIERADLYNRCILISLGIGASYEVLFMALFDTTPGKQLFGLKLVFVKEKRSYLTNKAFYLVRAAVKAVSIYIISAIPFIFLCLTAYGNEEGRSGFDFVAGTRVMVKTPSITSLFKRKS